MHLVILAVLLGIQGGSAVDNGLAIAPPLGWRSWNFYGMTFTQKDMMSQAAAMTERKGGRPSLADVGYGQLGIDMGWEGCGKGLNGSFHTSKGWPIVNTDKFPNLTDMNHALHEMGLKTGFYFNPCWCSVEWKVWPHGNTAHDVATVLELGFDGIKIDGCGPANNMSLWGQLLNASTHPLLIEDCLDKHFWGNGKEPPTPTAQLLRDCPSNFYRTTTDILGHFYSIMGNLMTSEAFTKEHEMDFGPVSRPGCWAYPDMLQVGNNHKCAPSVPKEFCPQISVVESYTHFAAWCITSAPLILGFDLANSTAYDEVYPIVTNALALKINQEWAGQPGGLAECSKENFTTHDVTTTVTSFPYWQIWHKPLKTAQGAVTAAVLVINLSNETRNVTLTYAAVDSLLGDTVTGTDVWTGKSVAMGVKNTIFSLDPHASRFLVLKTAADDSAADEWRLHSQSDSGKGAAVEGCDEECKKTVCANGGNVRACGCKPPCPSSPVKPI